MKRIIIITIMVIGLISCSKDINSKLIGTWINFNLYNGIKEITFTKETIEINEYKLGGNPDNKIIWEYLIIDDIIFIKENNNVEYYYGSPFFNYLVMDNKLIMTGDYFEIFTKKNNKNISNIKKKLNGRWNFNENDKNIEFIFSDNKLNIIEYNINGDINVENNTTFEINENYLIFENKMDILRQIYLYNNTLLYFINNDVLYLFQGAVGEIEPKMIYIYRIK